MILTVKDGIKEFVLKSMSLMIITFDDDSEIELEHIKNTDVDLSRCETSYIYVTCHMQKIDLMNCFSKNKKIKHIHFKGIGIDICDCEEKESFYDIPCDMKMNRLKFDTMYNNGEGEMYFELEGFVK